MAKVEKDWHEFISQPTYDKTKELKDIFIPMRDGVKLACDIYYPDADGKFPALIAFQAFGKNHEDLQFRFPPQARPSQLWDGGLEGGNTSYLVARGYGHVVVDARGTGDSEGDYYGVMGSGRGGEGRDIYDVIEWIAQQPWCDGNVGMIGISYLAAMQVLAAGEHPPHLRAIFPEGGHFDMYEMCYQGGIMWMMPRAFMEGRGGDSGIVLKKRMSFMKQTLSKQEFDRRIQERLNDPDIKAYPTFHQILKYPEFSPLWLDFVLNPCDGPFYTKAKPANNFDKIKIPVHMGCQWGRGWVVDGTISGFLSLKGPKKLVLRSAPPMQERPFHQFHDEIVRWYDHWLKGIDSGIMDEPPIKLFVHGINEWRFENEWPLSRTKWTKFYLRTRHRLLPEPEPFDTEVVPPDGFYQAPLTVTNTVGSVKYRTPALRENTEITGPCALYLHASIDTDDTNWLVRICDIDPHNNRSVVTTGWLKASLREIDNAASQPWAPHHPYMRSIPVPPGRIVEYPIKVYPFSNVFKKGHSIELEVRSVESESDVDPGMPPEGGHLNSGRATTHKIFRDKAHPSYLLLPVIPAT